MSSPAVATVAGAPPPLAPAPASRSHDGGLDGSAILLGLLGGLMLAGLVSATFSFMHALVRPFTIGILGQEVKPNIFAWIMAFLAFAAYLTNVFRQVHGLALVCTDREYRAEVDRFLGRGHRMVALFGLLFVLTVPAATAALMTSDVSYRWIRDAVCRSAVGDTYVSAAFGPGMICFAYLLTMAFYFVWDLVVFFVLRKEAMKGGEQTQFPIIPDASASTYFGYVKNWLSLCVLFGGPIIVMTLGAFSLTATGFYTPADLFGSPLLYLYLLIAVTFGFNICDYYSNRRFYFGK